MPLAPHVLRDAQRLAAERFASEIARIDMLFGPDPELLALISHQAMTAGLIGTTTAALMGTGHVSAEACLAVLTKALFAECPEINKQLAAIAAKKESI